MIDPLVLGSSWHAIDWERSHSDIGDRDHNRLHGRITGPSLPSAKCEECETVLYFGARHVLTELPNDDSVQQFADERFPIGLSSFLQRRDYLEGLLDIPYRLFPTDIFLPLIWDVGEQPTDEVHFPFQGFAVSAAVKLAWENAVLRGARFIPLKFRSRRHRGTYFLLSVVMSITELEQWPGCEYCEAKLRDAFPLRSLSPTDVTQVPDILWCRDQLIVNSKVLSVFQSHELAEELDIQPFDMSELSIACRSLYWAVLIE